MYSKKLDIRWADLDPNFHVLHSKYYDFGAYCRMAFLTEHGLTAALMRQHHFGPIIFREECFFKREISFGEEIIITLAVKSHSADYSRWSMEHEIRKGEIVAATINIDGAWMDTIKRKLTVPPAEVIHIFEHAPRSAGFTITEK